MASQQLASSLISLWLLGPTSIYRLHRFCLLAFSLGLTRVSFDLCHRGQPLWPLSERKPITSLSGRMEMNRPSFKDSTNEDIHFFFFQCLPFLPRPSAREVSLSLSLRESLEIARICACAELFFTTSLHH